MFKRDGMTLRCLDLDDVDAAYKWHRDSGIEIASGWVRPRSKTAFRAKFEAALRDPPQDFLSFGIEVEGRLIGRVDLAQIDREQGHGALGFFLGDRNAWGKGHAKAACIAMLDYAFHAENLHRVHAQVYDFNVRSQGLLRAVGMTPEGVLRQHELHNGARRDMHVFGMLRDEFTARYETAFPLPPDVCDPQ